jgi:hypothetical protein
MLDDPALDPAAEIAIIFEQEMRDAATAAPATLVSTNPIPAKTGARPVSRFLITSLPPAPQNWPN